MEKLDELNSLTDLDTVVDTDAHLMEVQEDFFPYLEEPFNEWFTARDESAKEGMWGNLASVYPAPGVVSPTKTGRVKTHDRSSNTPKDIYNGHIDKLNIDRVILTPSQNLALGTVHHDDLAAAMASAYNIWVDDTFLGVDPEFYANAVIPPQKPQKAVKEIERWANHSKFVGVQFPAAGANPLMGNEKYHPIYEAAEKAGMPIAMHSSARFDLISTFNHQFLGSTRYLVPHSTLHPAEQMTNLASLLTHGIPERFPNLNFIIQEGGIGWLPFFMRRFDHEYTIHRDDAPMLQKQPSQYIRDNFFISSQPAEGIDDPQYLKNVIEMIGTDNLLFSSDYPHPDFDNPDAFFNVVNSQFDDDTVRKIFSENAKYAYQFED